MNLKRPLKIAVAFPLVLVASVSFAFETWKTRPAGDPSPNVEMLSANPGTTSAIGQDDSHSDAQEADGKVLLLALKPQGFESNAITVPSGDYLVVVSNRTGLAELDIQVTREGAQTITAAAARGRRHLKQFLKLMPGTYVVSESTHPEWVCRVIVE